MPLQGSGDGAMISLGLSPYGLGSPPPRNGGLPGAQRNPCCCQLPPLRFPFFSYALLHVPLVHAGKRTLFQNILPVRPLSLALSLCEMGIMLTDGAATKTR